MCLNSYDANVSCTGQISFPIIEEILEESTLQKQSIIMGLTKSNEVLVLKLFVLELGEKNYKWLFS